MDSSNLSCPFYLHITKVSFAFACFYSNNMIKSISKQQKQAKENTVMNTDKISLVVFDWAGTTVDYGSSAPMVVF